MVIYVKIKNFGLLLFVLKLGIWFVLQLKILICANINFLCLILTRKIIIMILLFIGKKNFKIIIDRYPYIKFMTPPLDHHIHHSWPLLPPSSRLHTPPTPPFSMSFSDLSVSLFSLTHTYTILLSLYISLSLATVLLNPSLRSNKTAYHPI